MNNAWTPKQLLAKPDYFIKGKGAKALLMKRVGRKKKKLKLMYVMTPSANIRRRYNPKHVAQRGVDFHFPRLFKREFHPCDQEIPPAPLSFSIGGVSFSIGGVSFSIGGVSFSIGGVSFSIGGGHPSMGRGHAAVQNGKCCGAAWSSA